MRCDDVRLALSVRLDHEEPTAPEREVVGHLDRCSACRAWLAGAEHVTRAVRLQSVAVPDLTVRIMQAAQEADALPQPRGHRRDLAVLLRWALGALAVTQLMLALPELLGELSHDAHAGREVAASSIALAVGWLLVACYPEYARVFAPVVITLVVCLAAISALDVMQGVITPGRVAGHAVAVVEALLVWRLAATTRPRSVAA